MSDTADSDSQRLLCSFFLPDGLTRLLQRWPGHASTSKTASATSWSGNRITAVKMERGRDLECAEWAWRCGGLGSHDLQQANWRPESRCCGRQVSQQRMGKAETERGDDAILVSDWTTTRRPSRCSLACRQAFPGPLLCDACPWLAANVNGRPKTPKIVPSSHSRKCMLPNGT